MAVCETCSVVDRCLADAIAVEAGGYVFGVRGAMTPGEREALRIEPTTVSRH